MPKITDIHAFEILNAKGNPTIEVTVRADDGTTATASCPTGTSVGSYEAVNIYDRDEKRFKGLGMLTAKDTIEKIIAPKLTGMDIFDQPGIDKAMIELDGTKEKAKLGVNSLLPVSMAVMRGAAQSAKLPLYSYVRQFVKNQDSLYKIPTPLFNLINGGRHVFSGFDFQEFLVIPATSKSYPEALQLGFTVYNSLAEILMNNNLQTLVGDEGGFSPKLGKNSEAFQLLKDAVDRANIRFGFDIFFGLDAASNSFKSGGEYKIKDRSSPYTTNDLLNYYRVSNDSYHLLYIEDPFGEDDWGGWTQISQQITNAIIVGDDLVATNPYRLQTALEKKAISGVVIKPNQIGTIIESLAVVEVARSAGLKIIVSHRSGETNDDFLADFAVGVQADYVKFGAPVRGERVAKYNRLIHIDEEIKKTGQIET